MRSFVLCAATLCSLIPCASRVLAAPVTDALRTELKLLAEDVAKIIAKKDGGSIAIGEFGGSVEVIGNVGPGIQLTLAEELRAAGLTVDNENYRFELSGKYLPFKDTAENRREIGEDDKVASNLLGVRLVALLSTKNGEPLSERPTGRLIFGSEAVPTMLGLSTSNTPIRDPRELLQSFDRARQEPQVELQGTLIKGKTDQYAIELLVKQGATYVARPVTMEKGQPYVELKVADLYGVRLINNSKHEAGVELRIDGVNCFAFSKSQSQFWIIDPQSQTDVIGWHRDNSTTTEFKVVANFPETAAAKLKLKPSAAIGLITVSFSAAWAQDADRPDDEPLVQGRGTGFGNDVEFKTDEVTRTIGQVRDVLSVRYER